MGRSWDNPGQLIDMGFAPRLVQHCLLPAAIRPQPRLQRHEKLRERRPLFVKCPQNCSRV